MTDAMFWGLALVPAWVVLAVAVALGGAWHAWKLRRVFPPATLRRLVPASVTVRRVIRDLAVLSGLALGIVAVVEPRYPEEIHTVDAEGIDLVIALDLSRSMDCTDVSPSRLERARREILDLLDVSDGDRLGLVLYAGGAYPRLPLTEDTLAFRKILEESNTSLFEAQGSELGEAIRVATKTLDGSTASSAKAILVLSDGEVHRPKDALTAASQAADKGVRIYAMGIGSGPAPIPVGDGTYVLDHGQQVLSTPSDQVLTDIARATGGAYVASVASAEDVQGLYREMRGGLGTAKHGKTAKRTSETAFQVPLFFGVLAMLFARWVGEGRRNLGGITAFVLAIGLAVSGTAQAATLADGDAAYRAGRFSEAERIFEDLAVDRPDDDDVLGRLGAARFRAGDYRGAAEAFARQSRLRGGDAKAEYNAGNADYRAGRLDDAAAHFQKGLELSPGDPGLSQNLGVVQKEIELRRKMAPPPPPKEKQSSGEGDQKQPGNQGKPQEGQPADGSGTGKPGEEADPSEADQRDQTDPGEAQPGKNGGKPGEKQKPGEPQESSGDPSGDAQDGAQAQPGLGKPGQGQKNGQQTDGQQRDDDGHDEAVAPGDASGAGSEGPDAAGSEGGATPETPAERQAKATLDEVEEGRFRMYVPGAGKGKPW